jgi:transposase-like protein
VRRRHLLQSKLGRPTDGQSGARQVGKIKITGAIKEESDTVHDVIARRSEMRSELQVFFMRSSIIYAVKKRVGRIIE